MLEVTGIAKHYKKKEVLKDVTFTLKKGECIGMIGANGCGKSTLLSIMAGITKADAGEIHFAGENLLKKPELFKKYIAYVPQNNPLIEELSVMDNLKLWYAGSVLDLKEQWDQGLLARFSLWDIRREKVKKLSGGMKKRLSIACAMATTAPVLIMDEPGAALDFPTKQDIREYLEEYLGKGGRVIFSSHEEAEFTVCDRLIALVNGKVMEVKEGMSKKEWMEQYFLS